MEVLVAHFQIISYNCFRWTENSMRALARTVDLSGRNTNERLQNTVGSSNMVTCGASSDRASAHALNFGNTGLGGLTLTTSQAPVTPRLRTEITH
jgi:hypothetical protein